MNSPAKISVCIIVKNAQATLKECLESLREFDEIILLDNGSTDATLQIAQDFNANYGKLHIKQSEFIGFGALKNLCVSYAKNEWILSLDSDEVLESSALSAIKAQNLQPQNIYAISRKNLYKGEWIKACGWSPDFVWRIFNKNFTRFNENIVHESVIIPPNAQKIRLQGHIKHYACGGIAQLLDKLQRYTTLYAEQNAHSSKKATMSKAITHFAWSFVKNYFFKKGVFYGYKGFVLSLCNALGSFFKYAKLYEVQRHKSATPQTTTLIITTYNQKERLSLVLDSVRNLNPLPKEVLIADDGSKADTREVIQSYAKDFPCELRHIWHEDKGFRLAQIRNEAIKSARGDYIIIIDGDMIVDSRFVAEHLRFAKRGVFLQGSRVILREAETANILESKNYALAFDSHSLKSTHCDFYANLIYTFSKTTAKIFRKKELIKGVRGCNMSFYKADCEAINGFNEEFVGWGREDSEFVARFLFKGGELRRVKHNAIAYHLYHAENPRTMLESNHKIYLDAISHKSKWAKMGLQKP
ncbi:glycosyltransferase family 2 protein [Helicobacter sp. 23-1046]